MTTDPSEKDILSQALERIDPSGTLQPGTEQYDYISDMILKWIDECGPENALQMAQKGAKHLDHWLRYCC